ncbi:MAG: hypothetical protein HZB53_13945 [Chloroflexi bacterium]|nr:hypothetical protein [Chloroflexota bacterium]
MKTPKRRPMLFTLLALLALAVLVACGAGAGPSAQDLEALKSQLALKDKEAAALKEQLAQAQKPSAPVAPVTVVQSGQLQPIPAGAQPTGWDTAESIRGGLKLLATYDSSGPNAWDPAAHPMVYYTSEGPAKEGSPGTNKLPGVQVIDAYSKQVIASRLFDLKNGTNGTPHTVGISPDGKYLYIAGGASDPEKLERILIINAQTLKLDMVLGLPAQRLHHAAGFKDWQGRDRVVIDNGFGATGGPHFVLDPKDRNRVVRAITYDNVRPMGHSYTAVDPTGKFMYISMGSDTIREGESYEAAMAKFDLETGKVTVIDGVGNHPIGVAFTADGKYTYVNDGTNSLTFKIDNATNKVVAKTSAAVIGPYGLRLNWDETQLWTVGKGEGSHNRGGALGLIDTREFRPNRETNQPFNLGGSASSIDHAILHPDPAVNEMWVSNMNGWETIVFDLNTKKTKAYIASPNGGDTHSGGFVKYDKDFKGELLIDMFGPQKPMYAMILEKAKAAAAK